MLLVKAFNRKKRLDLDFRFVLLGRLISEVIFGN